MWTAPGLHCGIGTSYICRPLGLLTDAFNRHAGAPEASTMPQTNAQVTLQVSGVTQAEVETHKAEYNHILAQVLP